MIRVINEFLLEYPKVSIDAELSTRESRLVEEGLDLVIRIGQPEDSSLIARHLFSVSRGLYASQAYLENNPHPTEPSQLEKHACISLGTPQMSPWWKLEKEGQVYKHKPTGPFKINNLSCSMDAALAGIGIACLPHFLCYDYTPQGDLVEILPDWQVNDADIYALYPHRRFTPSTVRHFIEFTQKTIQLLSNEISDTSPIGLYSLS